MKTVLLLWFSLITCIWADTSSPIPVEVVYATDLVPGKEFTLWKETDLQKYNGTYSGEIGGDSGGILKIKFEKKIQDLINKTYAFAASGTYQHQTAGSQETLVSFNNAFSYEEGVVDAGAFSLIFVTFENQKGVIINRFFIPKEK